MTEVTTADAARRLGLTQERVSQMLRSGELNGRRISARGWLVDLASVGDRSRSATVGGRPWSELRVRSVIDALSTGDVAEARTRDAIRGAEVEVLWRKLAQSVSVRHFTARHPDVARDALVLTGESAIDILGERLVGRSAVVHGYLRDGDFEDLVDDAGLVEKAGGAVAVYRFRSGSRLWTAGDRAPRALVAADCARSAAFRVRSIGVRALDEMRQAWLTENT
ncbi:hypothetical protein [Microbacterium sp. C7(2022)]|uniref:hypothetical protein n=1 Tax=Microbacterium sp. C7(2022) TaxID=2992759 RepID=UPI00237BBBA8|nr:hypothetical protein [Microbacterium sp. C7(2022)]MDE0547608.1 hypothetical protein [Microbacterium sp. C7(2022)]